MSERIPDKKGEQIAKALAEVRALELPIDHNDAWQLSIHNRHHSNIARCYLDLMTARSAIEPPSDVWMVSNKTSMVLFDSQEHARAYVSRFGAATGGGMSITNLPVFGASTDGGSHG